MNSNQPPRWATALTLLALLGPTGCVSTDKYEAALADAGRAKTRLRERDAEVGELGAKNASLRRSLEQASGVIDELRGGVEKTHERSRELARTVEQTRAELAELQRARARAEVRAAQFRQLALRLQKMIDAGSLRVTVRDGRVVLVLPNDVLFDSGRVQVKPAGRDALTEVAAALKPMGDRHFQVAGHTDNVPIDNARFASNWELSTQRAVEVVRLMVGQGVAAEALSAAGYSEYDPVASNASPEGKAKNRRIEITLVPNVDELVRVPER
ncbi:MAG TPA: OmpA family protein [Polyangiaceae bacterium]|nr:OmpA family protein [Polyangiaceae bacterium]